MSPLSTDCTEFQSTLLMRGATRQWRQYQSKARYFNPRSSCEERPPTIANVLPLPSYFNPRSSCEERLAATDVAADKRAISIHAPHARSDDWAAIWQAHCTHFNPRSSCEERRGVISLKTADRIFQSTLLMRGATKFELGYFDTLEISIHAPHARSDAHSCRQSNRR